MEVKASLSFGHALIFLYAMPLRVLRDCSSPPIEEEASERKLIGPPTDEKRLCRVARLLVD